MNEPMTTDQHAPAAAAIEPKRPLVALAERAAGNLSINILLLAIVLAGLPLAVWLDLRSLSENSLRSQVDSLASVIGNFRNYYSSNVVGRVLGHDGRVAAEANYQEIPGAIPI